MAVPLTNISAETVAAALLAHWISQFGCPLTITTDQGTQFESALFRELARLTRAKHIHTTPYHPQANGIVERLHRTVMAALMYEPHMQWPERLPITLLGLRCCWKEDLQATPAEMLYGILRLPGEFFVPDSIPADSRAFVGKLKTMFHDIRAVPASMHAKYRIFQHDSLNSCTHVFLRNDAVRKLLQPPYSGPHEVVRRISDKVYVIRVNGQEKTVSTDDLKPRQTQPPQDSPPQTPTPPQGIPAADHCTAEEGRLLRSPPSRQPPPSLATDQPCRTFSRKRVSFPSCRTKVTEGGVPVGTPAAPKEPAPRQRKQALQQCLWEEEASKISALALSSHGRPRLHMQLAHHIPVHCIFKPILTST